MTNIQSPVLLRTIKGTAMNKGRARVWLEMPEDQLKAHGFTRGCRLNIDLHSHHITVTAAPDGQRKMAGREKAGKTICILDICFPAAQREAMFKGADKLQVWAGNGVIRFTAAEVSA